ncbi:MAG: hypothetical protein KKG33_11945 [candidate division Zixibacteria bacterium]|nr:hypothetical protein [candidate division Zixibacteria bacterium]MBU1471381.1 hypothetical protein [candidate division Zixibacteria bacterium]MBU2626260.1 hypothetical protein [candidate division Zixibacteria bacterium]
MKAGKHILIQLMTLCAVLSIAAASSACAGDSDFKNASLTDTYPVIAVLPLVDYCDNVAAVALIDSLIEDQFDRGTLASIEFDSLRQALRHHRIRSAGEITVDGASVLADDLGAEFLMLGSCDIYFDGEVPEAGISVRLLDIEAGRIVWAISEAATGNDFAGLFGIGRITSAETLAEKLVERVFKSLNNYVIRDRAAVPIDADADKYALVPFDNLSDNRQAGSIITSVLLSEMVGRGLNVEEPGEVNEMFRMIGEQPRGAVDIKSLRLLHDSLGVDFVVTGTVDRFKRGLADVTGSSPGIEISGRLIETRTGRIVGSCEIARNGTDSEIVLGMGECHSIGRLAGNMAHSLLDKLESHRKEWFAGGGSDNKQGNR